MPIPSRRRSAIVLGLGLATIAVTAGLANPGSAAKLTCGVTKISQNGMVALQATILSPDAISGDYSLAVRSSSQAGSSNISQGGAFSAQADQATTIGQVMVNADARTDIAFDITANGKKHDCSQELGRAL